jgi:hypothetical protein
MRKPTFMTVVIAALAALVGYLALHPTAAADVTAWLQRQAGIPDELPVTQPISYPAYTPVVPSKGL